MSPALYLSSFESPCMGVVLALAQRSWLLCSWLSHLSFAQKQNSYTSVWGLSRGSWLNGEERDPSVKHLASTMHNVTGQWMRK